MNQFSYESRVKEKIQALVEEGMRSQTAYRSGASKRFTFGLPRLIFVLLALTGFLELIIH